MNFLRFLDRIKVYVLFVTVLLTIVTVAFHMSPNIVPYVIMLLFPSLGITCVVDLVKSIRSGMLFEILFDAAMIVYLIYASISMYEPMLAYFVNGTLPITIRELTLMEKLRNTYIAISTGAVAAYVFNATIGCVQKCCGKQQRGKPE